MRRSVLQVGEALDVAVGLGHDGHEAEVVAVGEAHVLAAGVRGRDGGGSDVELLVLDLGEQGGEVGGDELDLEAQLAGDGAQQLVVVAGELAGGIDEDVRRGIGERADLKLAFGVQAQLGLVDLVDRGDLSGGVLVQRLLIAAGQGVRGRAGGLGSPAAGREGGGQGNSHRNAGQPLHGFRFHQVVTFI